MKNNYDSLYVIIGVDAYKTITKEGEDPVKKTVIKEKVFLSPKNLTEAKKMMNDALDNLLKKNSLKIK